MVSKRITFALLYSKGFFYLSRNFRLQKVGDVDWLEKNYSFNETCKYIDELVFILVTKDPEKNEVDNFLKDTEKVRERVFAPIMLGGNIRNLEDVKKYFHNGADKIIINTEAKNNNLINEVCEIYGSQAISIMIDYKFNKEKMKNEIFTNCGSSKVEVDITEYLNSFSLDKIGEVILHSIDKDGTGNGYDFKILKNYENEFNKPILLMGGAGKPEHIVEALKLKKVSGIITANIFNFIGNGLKITREKAIQEKINIAKLI